MFPQGFPKTASGVEIEVLKTLLTPPEAELMLELRPYPETVASISARGKRDPDELGRILYDLSKRGLILRGAFAGDTYYFLVPWMVGIWEFQLKKLNLDNIALYERFFQEGIVPERLKRNTAGFRVIPVEREIEGHTEIQPFEKVSRIIESSSRFAVAECICRKEARLTGHGCDKLLEACMMFDLAAEYYIENGLGREINREEALAVLTRTEESGLVHCSNNHADSKMFICNCCGCCCKALGFITKYNHLPSIAKSNYYAKIDPDQCQACEICVGRCQVGAITIQDDVARLDVNRCIGCGLCVSTCSAQALEMVRKSPGQDSPVFANNLEFLQAMARERGQQFPFE
jgi:Fe-S-cluster-containing hydrogenase component 2